MHLIKWKPKRLKTQIISLFFIFTLLFSGILSTIFIGLSQRGERKLQSIDMGLAIKRIRYQYLNGENVGRVNRFFHAPKFSTQFPNWVRHLPEGFHKIQRDHLIWHVMVVDYPDQRYILLRDYTSFELDRPSPLTLSLFILLTSLFLSLILVYVTILVVIRPIERLEKSIRQDLKPQLTQQLAENYPHNEIGQLAQAFDEVYDQFNQALQRERLFTADVSHELRTPLMVILSSCELLQATTTMLPEKSQQRLHSIQDSAQRILQRLQIYLALARQNSASAYDFEQQTLIAIATQVIQDNQNFAQRYQVILILENNVTSTCEYPADLCYTVMSNLIRNAIEYAGRHSTIVLTLEETGFSVSDNGQGIAPELQPQLFEAFFGSNTSAKHLGLGLSLVQRICQYLHWQIEFASVPQQGTCFTICTQPRWQG